MVHTIFSMSFEFFIYKGNRQDTREHIQGKSAGRNPLRFAPHKREEENRHVSSVVV
jgi:hypothetical protein